MGLFLVVVADLDVMGVSVLPAEADSPLVVDPNAVLADAVPGEALQAVPWRHAELVQSLGGVHEQQLAVRSSLHVRCQLARPLPLKHLPCLGVPEGSNHRGSVTRSINSVNRYYRGAQPNKALELTGRHPGCATLSSPPPSRSVGD